MLKNPESEIAALPAELAAAAVRLRVQNGLKQSIEDDILTNPFVMTGFDKVEHVVEEAKMLSPQHQEIADQSLLTIGNLDDDEAFRDFATRLLARR